MLDTETKQRINTARDILVGKVPDPKSQVEQITIALIYKFMDDMDKEAVDFGGQPSFFTGEYEKYSWTKIFDPKMGGFDMLNLYSEAIVKLNHNPALPQLFRDIFKNAYLPYRDPETLKLFLKTINEFHYDHSERLGDAFEYLLSVLGSQGDAGQFRTPRHIIDFIVEVLAPKKGETICDPACGTAGFLISAYKHIVAANTKKLKGDELTPDDKKKLIQNFTGYDISPDMVRLSLVNMYLHGFTAPKVYEYDTLTSEDRWGEYYDIILANPPFMSPKGGIKPHKKFSIQANRSEALFVDYIAEHINPISGRAAIIVPEGVIFKSETAFKSIRKLLVDKNYLYAVVSLPVGVFNPYSGVKTSVLLMDKTVAKKSDSILIVKIEADGFELGAQRRPIEKNDLPAATKLLKDYKEHILSGSSFVYDDKNALLIGKEKIKGNGDYNLAIDRYRDTKTHLSDWDLIRLGNICNFEGGTQPPKETFINEPRDGYIRLLQIRDYKSDKNAVYIPKTERHKTCTKEDIMIGRYGPPVFQILRGKEGAYNVALMKCIPNNEYLSNDWLYHFLKSDRIQTLVIGLSERVRQSGVSPDDLRDLLIPLPPLSVQQEIVSKIEGYQRIIDGARQVVEAYKPQIDIDPDWELVELGKVCEIKSGGTPSREKKEYWDGDIPWIKTGQIDFNKIYEAEEFITSAGKENSSAKLISKGAILMAMYGQGITRGKVALLEIDATINQACAAITIQSPDLLRDFLFEVLKSKYSYLRSISDDRGGNQSNLNAQLIKDLIIPIPPIEVQQRILSQIEREQNLINSNKELITLYEQKIKTEIAKLWQEEKTETVTADKFLVPDLE